MEEKSKLGGIDKLPEKLSQAVPDPGVGVGSVRLDMVGCVYCVLAEFKVEELEELEIEAWGLNC